MYSFHSRYKQHRRYELQLFCRIASHLWWSSPPLFSFSRQLHCLLCPSHYYFNCGWTSFYSTINATQQTTALSNSRRIPRTTKSSTSFFCRRTPFLWVDWYCKNGNLVSAVRDNLLLRICLIATRRGSVVCVGGDKWRRHHSQRWISTSVRSEFLAICAWLDPFSILSQCWSNQRQRCDVGNKFTGR